MDPDNSPTMLTRGRWVSWWRCCAICSSTRAFFSFCLTINHALAPSVDNATPTTKKMPMATASLLRKVVRSANTSCSLEATQIDQNVFPRRTGRNTAYFLVGLTFRSAIRCEVYSAVPSRPWSMALTRVRDEGLSLLESHMDVPVKPGTGV